MVTLTQVRIGDIKEKETLDDKQEGKDFLLLVHHDNGHADT